MFRNQIELYRRLRGKLRYDPTGWTEFPRVIQIDTNNFCGPAYCRGTHCVYCFPTWAVQNGLKHYAQMPMEDIIWILKEVGRDGRKCRSLDMFLNGDGLTEPRLTEICRLSKKYAPFVSTQTFTCGVRQENWPVLVDSDLDCVCFTISGHNREVYEKVHGADNFNEAVGTLSHFLERKRSSQRCEVHCVVNKYNIRFMREWWDSFEWAAKKGCRRVLSPLVASTYNKPSSEAAEGLELSKVQQNIFSISGDAGAMWDTTKIPFPDPCVLWHNSSFEVDLVGGKPVSYALQCCNWSDSKKWNYGTIAEFRKQGISLKEYWRNRQVNLMDNPLCAECNMKSSEVAARLGWVKRHVL